MRRFDPDTVPERPNLFFYKRGGSIPIGLTSAFSVG